MPNNPNKTVANPNPIPTSKIPSKSVTPVTVPIRVLAQKPLFRFDAAAAPKFEITWKEMQANKPSLGLPKGIVLECWKPDADGVFRCGNLNDIAGLSVMNLTHSTSAQLGFDIERECQCPLVDDNEYRFRIYYRTTPGIVGYFDIKDLQHKTIQRQALADTAGQWIAEEFNFKRPAGVPIRIVVGTDNVGAGSSVSISTLEIFDPNDVVLPQSAERTLLSPDFSKYSLFRERGKLVPDTNNPKEFNWTAIQKTGILPPQWSGRTYRHRSEGEWSVEKIDDQPVIGFRTASGDGSMMLFAPHFDTTSGKCHLELTYRIETGNANVSLRFKPQRPQNINAWDVAKLSSTDGKWATKTFEIDLKSAKGGYFELHNSDPKFLWAWVKKLTVTENAVEPESPLIADGPVVSSFDFITMKPGKFLFADAKFKDGNSPLLPNGSFVDCWKATSVAEFRVEEIEGKTGLGITNLNDDLSAQIHVRELGNLIAKKTYRARVEYLTTNDAIGKILVRIVGGTYPVVNGIDLTSTGGKWKTATFDFVQQGVPLDLQISNSIVGEGNRLTVRKIEILDTKSIAPVTTEKIVYTADFGSMGCRPRFVRIRLRASSGRRVGVATSVGLRSNPPASGRPRRVSRTPTATSTPRSIRTRISRCPSAAR